MAIVINDTVPRNQYTASAGQTAFNIDFEFFAVTDLKVYNGTTLLSYNASPSSASQYSVTGAGTNASGAGKKIDLGGGASLNDVITIIRDVPVARTSDFPSSGQFEIETLNTELDKITTMIADREDERLRSLYAPETDATNIDMEIPVKASRVGKLLAFNSSTGNPEAHDKLSTVTVSASEGTPSDSTASLSSDGRTLTLNLVFNPAGATGPQGPAGDMSEADTIALAVALG